MFIVIYMYHGFIYYLLYSQVREHEKCVSNVWKIKEEVSSVLDKKIAELHGKSTATDNGYVLAQLFLVSVF